MKKVVCIGGGTGQSALLRGLKQIDDIELSTIVAMADNGGSTGRLRDELNLPAMGDVRNVMVTLAEKEDLMTQLMNYRFGSDTKELANHSFGNILLSALTKINGDDFLQAVSQLSDILNVKGNIYPSTLDKVTLMAEMIDGTIIEGESQIRENEKQIKRVFYNKEVNTYKQVIRAINNADYVIVGIGSLFTSILPNLIIDDIKESLINCKGKVIYYCNSMTEVGETDNYSLEDHIKVIENHLGNRVIDAVVIHNDIIPSKCLSRYSDEGAREVKIREIHHDYKVFSHSLLNFENNVVRHDSGKVRDSFMNVMREM